LGWGCLNLAEGAKQVGFSGVHLAAMKGVVDLQKAVEDAALIERLRDPIEWRGFAGKGY
jgi:hypothetical protein